MAALVAAMTEHHIIHNLRIEARGGKRTGCHDEAVNHNYQMALGCTEHCSYGCNHLETTEIAYYLFSVAAIES